MPTANRASLLFAIASAACLPACDVGETHPPQAPAGMERMQVVAVGPEGGEFFGHTWLDSEFGRFSQTHTVVEARALPDGAVRVEVSGASIPMYEATFTFLAGGESCDVEVWWFRDSGPDDQLSGRMTVLEGYVWSAGLDVEGGRVATHFGFSLRGLREGEPVVLGGEVLLRPEDARDG